MPSGRNAALVDYDSTKLLLTRFPRGPKMHNADSTIVVGYRVFCFTEFPDGSSQIVQSLNSTIHSIANRAILGTGGHLMAHDTAKPVGAWNPDSGALPNAAGGWFAAEYTTEMASGDERLVVQYTPNDTRCAGIRDSLIDTSAVRVPGLVRVTAGVEHLYLDSITSNHDDIFFATPRAHDITEVIARDYYVESPRETGEQDSLKITSISLRYGGLKDNNNDWRPPHRTHRLGTDVDVNGWDPLDAELHKVLIKLGQRAGSRLCEPHGDPPNHVHCFTGPRYRD